MRLRLGWLSLVLVGCGPQVAASSGAGSTSDRGSSSAGESSTSSSSAVEGSTSSSSTISEVSSSSSGQPAEEVVVEGMWRGIDSLKNPIQFQTCEGEWLPLVWAADSTGPSIPRCAGFRLRLRGTRGLVPGHISSQEGLIVQEVLGGGPCEPGDCGVETCEPPWCIHQCDQQSQQDCPDGEKCVFYSVAGGVEGASRCVPLDPEPVGLEESCLRDEVELGLDNCGAGAVCLGGFGDREGVCVEMCSGTNTMPTCPEGECTYGPGAGTYCLPPCDPDASDCDGVCLAPISSFQPVCMPLVGLPELLPSCEDDGCPDGFMCGESGPVEGLCVRTP